MKRKKILLTAVKLLFSGGLLFLLYRKIPLDAMRGVLASVNYWYLVPIGVLMFVNTVLSAQKWGFLLKSDGVYIPLSTLTVTYLIGSFYNLFLPSSIGGDSYRIYDIAQKSSDGVRSAASVFADRFSGFLALVILGLLSSVPVALKFHNPLFFLGPFSILLLLLALLAALIKQKPIHFLLAVTRLDSFPFITHLVEKFFLSFRCYGADRRLLVRIMAISFSFQFSVICIVYLLSLALHTSVSFFYFSAFVPLITLLEALPVSIYGLGLRDAGYVFFFGWAGMTDLQTRSLALLFLGVTVCYSLVGGLVYLGRILSADSSDSLKNS